MAATIRVIMPKLQYPPFRKETKNTKGKRNRDGCSGDNLAYTAIIQAMLHHAKGLQPDATEITVSPAIQQIADVCQVNKRTIQRYLAELKKHGTITAQNKGSKISSDFTIHVEPLGVTPSVMPESASRGDTVPPSDMTQSDLGVTQSGVRGDTKGRPQGYIPSGVIPQDKASQDGERLPPSPSAGVRQLGGEEKNGNQEKKRPVVAAKAVMSDKLDAAIAELDSRPWTKRSGMEKERDEWARAIDLFLRLLRSNVGMGLHLNMIGKEAEAEGINLPNGSEPSSLYAVIELLMKLQFVTRVKGTIYLAKHAPKGDN